MAKEKKSCVRVADTDVIRRHKPRGLTITDGETGPFVVERIVFGRIQKAPWFGPQNEPEYQLIGKVEFHSDDGRCFYAHPNGLPFPRHAVTEKGSKYSGHQYIVTVSNKELRRIYEDSREPERN